MQFPFLKLFSITVILGIIFLNVNFLNLKNHPSRFHGDTYQENFVLNHWLRVFTSGNISDFSNLKMFYGFENSLFFSDQHFIQAVLTLPAYLITRNLILSANVTHNFTLILSFISMFAFVNYLTKRFWPSAIASLIFVFNPFVMAHFPDHLSLYTLQFIPLIFLFLEKSLEKPNSKNLFLTFFFLTCQLLSSVYYFAFLTIILPVYAVLRIWQKKIKIKAYFNLGMALGLALIVTVGLTTYRFYSQAFTGYELEKRSEISSIYSIWLSDLFFASSSNFLYGNWREIVGNNFPKLTSPYIFSAENNFFPGFVPVFILIIGIARWKNVKSHLLKVCLFMLTFALLLSFGPIMHFTQELKFPGLYSLFYSLDPALHFTRVPARFGVFFFFFLAISIALIWYHLSKQLKPNRLSILSLVVIGLIAAEYFNKPLQFDKFTKEEIGFYSQLEKMKGVKVILDLPIGNELPNHPLSRATYDDSIYLLLATTLHSKTLLNGYSGLIPKEYYTKTDILTLNFPTKSKLELLKTWGIDAIVLHKEEFSDEHYYYQIKERLNAFGIPPVEETENLSLFKL